MSIKNQILHEIFVTSWAPKYHLIKRTYWQPQKKIGIGLVGIGGFFLFLGIVLLFDKGLLAIGNILFISGIAFIVGLDKTRRFFFQSNKLKASGFFFGGIIVVLIGWPIVGMILELYGFFLLFKGFFPFVIEFLRRIPGLGLILNLPFISSFVEKIAGDTRRSNV